MRGSKILLALIAVLLLAAPFASAGDEMGLPTDLPTDKTSGTTTYKLVRFDGIVYRIASEVAELFFRKLDDEQHSFTIKPVDDEPIPFCVVVDEWGMFSSVSLGLGMDWTNDWLLGTETGYAEK